MVAQIPSSDEDERAHLVDRLETTVRETIADTNVDVRMMQIFDGDVFPHTDVDCPICGEKLNLFELMPDSKDGANALATCTCGWSGRAIYRLIDLLDDRQKEVNKQHTIDSAISGDPTDGVSDPPLSAVARGDMTIKYIAHTGTESYRFIDF